MHGFKHRAQRFHSHYAAVQALARQGDYEARITNNLFEARVIVFETSPHRLLSGHAYKNALYATRRLIANSFLLRRDATKQSHHAAVNKIDALLLSAREKAMIKSFDVSIAQDVFVLLSHYLGLTAVPEERVDYRRTSSFARHKSFIAGRLHDGTRKLSRRRSVQAGFANKSTSLVDVDLEDNLRRKLPRSYVSLSNLDAEYVEEIPLYAT